MSRTFMLLGGTVLTLALGGVAAAQPQSELRYPHPTCFSRKPNTATWGFYPTTWRNWPGEDRTAEDNPRAVGAEVLRTPEGHEEVPIPQGTAPLAQPPRPPQQPPAEQGGGILPPENPQSPNPLNELPSEPKSPKPSKSADEGGLPGLPVETEQSILPSQLGDEPGAKKDAPPKKDTAPKKETAPKESPKPTEKPKAKEKTLPKTSSGLMLPRDLSMDRADRATRLMVRDDALEVPPEIMVPALDDAAAIRDRSRGLYHADSVATAAQEPLAAKPASYVADPAEHAEVAKREIAAPTVALGGYCLVELVRNGRWVMGDVRYTVVHGGSIYRFSGPTQRQQFLASPDAFVPAFSGNDPVLAVDSNRTVPGRLTFCTTFKGRLYMFSSAATQTQFNKKPERYLAGN